MVMVLLVCGVALGALSAIITLLLGYGVLWGLLAYMLGGAVGVGLAAMVLRWKNRNRQVADKR